VFYIYQLKMSFYIKITTAQLYILFFSTVYLNVHVYYKLLIYYLTFLAIESDNFISFLFS